jgi:hypothetical protein
MPRDSIDAQARGRRRFYKHKLAADYSAFDAIWKSITTTQVGDFMLKSAKGRRRVFDRINAAVTRCGARLEALRLDGRRPLALWAILKPRGAVSVDPEEPRDGQSCVCVNYFAAGWRPDTPGGCVSEGLWSFEMTDHALGRCLQRTPGVDLTAAIFAAHHAVLNVDSRDLPQEAAIPFRLRVGPATWMCEIRVGYDISSNDREVRIVVRNYLEFDQLSPRQESELMIEPRPQANGFRLGDAWLMPCPFRRLRCDGALMLTDVSIEPPPLIALAGGARQ